MLVLVEKTGKNQVEPGQEIRVECSSIITLFFA